MPTYPAVLYRFASYYRRNGLLATIRRCLVAISRAVYLDRSAIYCVDLSTLRDTPIPLPPGLSIERKRTEADLEAKDLQAILDRSDSRLVRREMAEQFEQGASLWLIKVGDDVAGFHWSLRGGTMVPHFIPLTEHDVHMFDAFVWPRFRGQGLNPLLANYVLHELASELSGRGRAFVEVAVWNRPQLASVKKMPYCLIGLANKFTIGKHTFVWWHSSH